MTKSTINNTAKCFLLIFSIFLMGFNLLIAQNTYDSLNGRNLYRPQTHRLNDSNVLSDSVSQTITAEQDSLSAYQKYKEDSIAARLKFIEDSIAARMAFIQDSIAKREAFIRDSIARRERILDSLNFLRKELPCLFDASLKSVTDDIYISFSPLKILYDSVLSDFTFRTLPFNYEKPFTPWVSTIKLSYNPVEIDVDTVAHKIKSVKTPFFSSFYQYSKNKHIMRINSSGTILNKQGEKYYKSPIDSIFFDAQRRVSKIKKYVQYYSVVNNFQRGKPIKLHLEQVKQYEYSQSGLMSKYQVVTFCDLWSERGPEKVCTIINYYLSKQGNIYTLKRQYEPANKFSDGIWHFEFDNQYVFKAVDYKNSNGSEDWKVIVELNEQGYVSRYIYQNKGAVNQTLLINYYLDDPKAKHKVETITCIFEDDGISYFQQNNTTGKSRRRDRMTLEWSPWR